MPNYGPLNYGQRPDYQPDVPDLGFLDRLTPEQREALSEPFSQKSAILEDQLAQAQAMRRPGQKFNTWGGAVAGGIGDILRGISADKRESALRAQQEALLAREQKSAGGLLDAYRAYGSMPELLRRPRAQPMDAPGAPFGLNFGGY